jgi:methylmalonyl-CoA mutase N-terminal domain/subunit
VYSDPCFSDDRADPLDGRRERAADRERGGVSGNRNSLAPESLKSLQQAARDRKNVFAQLMEAVKFNSEGQISHALCDVGGEYRRNM